MTQRITSAELRHVSETVVSAIFSGASAPSPNLSKVVADVLEPMLNRILSTRYNSLLDAVSHAAADERDTVDTHVRNQFRPLVDDVLELIGSLNKTLDAHLAAHEQLEAARQIYSTLLSTINHAEEPE